SRGGRCGRRRGRRGSRRCGARTGRLRSWQTPGCAGGRRSRLALQRGGDGFRGAARPRRGFFPRGESTAETVAVVAGLVEGERGAQGERGAVGVLELEAAAAVARVEQRLQGGTGVTGHWSVSFPVSAGRLIRASLCSGM